MVIRNNMKNKINNFKNLEVYRLANKLTLDIYELTADFPAEEKFSLVDQLKRAASSIGANIAEGFGRYHTKEYIKFLYVSRGSLMEVLHFLTLARDLQYIKMETLNKFENEIKDLGVRINNLIRALSNKLITRSHKDSQGVTDER